MGAASPLWQSRVRGQFPIQAEDALISLAWLERARNTRQAAIGKLSVGIDVAGPGEDETVAIVRDTAGNIVEFFASAAPETVAWNDCAAFLAK